MFCALTLGGTPSFTVRQQSHPRDPPQGYAEFQRTMAKKCLRTRLSSVCTLRHHAIHRRPADLRRSLLRQRPRPHRRAGGAPRRSSNLAARVCGGRWVGRPHFRLRQLRTCRRIRSWPLRANCDQGASQHPVIRSAWWRRLSSCCRCAARRLRDSRNAIYGMSAHWQRAYSGLILAARITLPHFSVSSAMSLPKSAGESASGTLPRSARRALIL